MTNKYDFEDQKMKLMVYGQPGCGKTTFAGSAALDDRMGKIMFLEAGANPIVLKHLRDKIDIFTMESMQDFNAPYEWLSEGQPPDGKFATENGLTPGYDTIIIDSLTEIQRFVVRKVAGGDFVKPGDLFPLLGRQGFGQLLGTMLNWAEHFIKLNMNVILVSHEANRQENNGPVRSMPLLWGQSGGEMCGQVLMVMRLVTTLALPANLKSKVKNEFNIGQVLETFPVYAKNQYGITNEYIFDPTVTKVMDLIEQGS